MAGLAVAALLGSGAAAAAGTAALVSSAIAGGSALYSTGKSFSEASKSKRRADRARQSVKKSMERARREINVNTAEQLSVPKEPYELMRNAALVSGAMGMQTGVEGESRGAAATAGRVQMAQQQQQAQIAAAQAERMFEIDQLKAEEDKRIAEQLASIDLQEAEGAAEARRYYEEDRQKYLEQGFAGLAELASAGLQNYEAGNFAKNAVDADGNAIPNTDRFGMTREQRRSLSREELRAARNAIREGRKGGQTFGPGESASQLLDQLASVGGGDPAAPAVNYDMPRDTRRRINREARRQRNQRDEMLSMEETRAELARLDEQDRQMELGTARGRRRSANQSVGVLAGPAFNTSSPEAIQGALDFVTGYDTGVDVGPTVGEPLRPGQLDRQMNRDIRPAQREMARVARQDQRERSRQQQPGLPPPMTLTEDMNLGGGSAFGGGPEPVSREALEQRMTEEARRSGAGPVDTSPAGPINTDVLMDAEIRRATERRGGMSFIPDDPLAADMAAFYGEDPPVRTPAGPRADGGGGGGDPMAAGETKMIPLSNSKELITALGSEAPADIRVNLERIANSPIAQPSTPEFIETANAEGVAAAAEAGPASAELAEVATSNTNVRNPLAVAMQWLGIREPDYGKKVKLEGQSDSTFVRHPVPVTSPESEALTLSIWGQIGHSDKMAQEWMETEAAWCAGFANKMLEDSMLTGLPTGELSKGQAAYSRGRALNYTASEFGENIFTSEAGSKVSLKDGSYGTLTAAEQKGAIKDGKLGDVVVVKTSEGHHVAFFAGIDEKTGKVKLLGGNQSNEVNVSTYDPSRVLTIRRVRQPDLTPEEQEKISSIIVQPGSGSTR